MFTQYECDAHYCNLIVAEPFNPIPTFVVLCSYICTVRITGTAKVMAGTAITGTGEPAANLPASVLHMGPAFTHIFACLIARISSDGITKSSGTLDHGSKGTASLCIDASEDCYKFKVDTEVCSSTTP